ncbi:MAG: amidase [Vicinamibacterales bacterium]
MDVTASPLCFASARDLAAQIRLRKVSAREVMAAHLAQIGRLNPELNAIVGKLDDEKCLALADEADAKLTRSAKVGPLHGLPTAFKDLESATGFPFTRGSLIFKDLMGTFDTLLVERVRAAGAVPIGKTNVPEFGMGSHTYNKVYGTTLNPYDRTRSAGGSSGGAAVALASGMLPIADGSDLGGSLRNPASFNNIVAIRPSVGLVPNVPVTIPLVSLSVKGPMARSVSDVAFLLSVLAGADARDPGSYPSTPAQFAQPLDRDFKGVRVAWCPDLGGLPLDRSVRGVLEAQWRTFESLGCIVEDAAPDLDGVEEIFLTLRAWMSGNVEAGLLAAHRDVMKPEAIAEIERGLTLTGAQVAAAMMRHAELLERVRLFQEQYEFILCTVSQLPPFDAALDWPKHVDGTPMDTYISWMKSAYWISATRRPSASVPAGFTEHGLPVGLQIVGRHRDDFGVLQMAYAFEQATRFGQRRPPGT